MKTIRFQPTEQRAAGRPVSLDTPSAERREALKRAERELKEACDYAQTIVETVPPL